MQNYVVLGLGFGDEAKGSVVSHLCQQNPDSVTVRFNGGAQAQHRVVTDDGREHVFSQWGSGTFSGCTTFLSRFMLVDPLALGEEADHLVQQGVQNPFDLLYVDKDALLITPYHRVANRLREGSRGEKAHGTTGRGIGETVRYSLVEEHPPKVEDLRFPDLLNRKLSRLQEWVDAQFGIKTFNPGVCKWSLDRMVAVGKKLQISDGSMLTKWLRFGPRQFPAVFEGAQGVLLDQDYGFNPHVTWSDCTYRNADILLDEAGQEALHIGVVRSYTTRHGAGPMVTEDPLLAGLLPEPGDSSLGWAGRFRVGHFDGPAHRYARDVLGVLGSPPDVLAVTHLDRVVAELNLCTSYGNVHGRQVATIPMPDDPSDFDFRRQVTDMLFEATPTYMFQGMDLSVMPEEWAKIIADHLQTPLGIMSFGPAPKDKISIERVLS